MNRLGNSCINDIYDKLHAADVPAICFVTPEGIHSVCFLIYSYRLERARYILIEDINSKLVVSAIPSDHITFVTFARFFMFGFNDCCKCVIDWIKWIKILTIAENTPLKFSVQVEAKSEFVEKAIEDIRNEISTIDYEKPSVIYSEDLLGIMEENEPDVYSDWEEYVVNKNK